MTVKTDMSRFQIHDELTAPDDSARLLQGMASAGGSVSKFVGVLAGAPAALRAFARMRHELPGGRAHPPPPRGGPVPPAPPPPPQPPRSPSGRRVGGGGGCRATAMTGCAEPGCGAT